MAGRWPITALGTLAAYAAWIWASGPSSFVVAVSVDAAAG